MTSSDFAMLIVVLVLFVLFIGSVLHYINTEIEYREAMKSEKRRML